MRLRVQRGETHESYPMRKNYRFHRKPGKIITNRQRKIIDFRMFMILIAVDPETGTTWPTDDHDQILA